MTTAIDRNRLLPTMNGQIDLAIKSLIEIYTDVYSQKINEMVSDGDLERKKTPNEARNETQRDRSYITALGALLKEVKDANPGFPESARPIQITALNRHIDEEAQKLGIANFPNVYSSVRSR